MGFTLASIVRGHAADRPDDEAVVCGDDRLSWAELDGRSSRVGSALLADGLGPGDRIAVLARNTTTFFELAFGCAKAGVVLVSLNWRLTAAELADVLHDADPAFVVADADLAGAVGGGLRVLRLGDPYDAWRDAAPADDPDVALAPDDLAYVLYSSGTTGRPKGVPITHANLALSERMAREAFRMDEGTVHMCPGPQFHIAGAGTGLMAMFLGARTVVLREITPRILLETIAREGVTHAFMVPAIVQAVVDAPELADHDVSSLRQISYGAAPMTEALLRRAMTALGCTFLGVYGMTETAGTVVTLDPDDHDPDGPRAGLLRSVGTPLPWIELQVRDLASGEEAAPGVVGEICVRSGQNTPGYWRQPETTARAIDEDGWLRTGDGAHRDEDGYVFLRDRIKDMIISGGENVYPAEVENALATHPDVADVAVIGVPHERWGETVKAVVVLQPGGTADAETLRAHARTLLAGYKCPTSVEVVAGLPRNPTGKVLKKVLRETYAAGASVAEVR
ncbi:long-chain-fatty-acid--CoA ligase [Patulibacter minatonensis]|uniref:long-chain-fatty-acid--CoA ligase n=1 Tax=Patulibacter minatonensis TaxID=298163 RepID=UPI0004798F46|nr:long-chain-fatty-acid--CoA ligase [Patulibacter minatonensis]